MFHPAGVTQPGAEFGLDRERHHVAEVDLGPHQPQLAAHGLGEAHDGVLGGRVGGPAGGPVLAGLGGDVDDVAAVAGDHPLERELHAQDHAVQVDVDHPPRREVVLVDEAPDLHDPGVVDEHVDRAQLLFGSVEELREGGALGDVEWQGDRAGAQFRGGLGSCLVVHVAYRDLHALGEEGFGGGTPDTPGGTGDRGCLSGEDAGLFGHLLLPRLRLSLSGPACCGPPRAGLHRPAVPQT